VMDARHLRLLALYMASHPQVAIGRALEEYDAPDGPALPQPPAPAASPGPVTPAGPIERATREVLHAADGMTAVPAPVTSPDMFTPAPVERDAAEYGAAQ